MKKKIGILLAVLLVAGTSNLFAFGVGLQVNANAERTFAPGLAVTAKFDSVPLVFAFNWNAGETVQVYGVTADYWAINKPITRIGKSSLNWFFGLGFFINLTFNQNDGQDEFQTASGLRVPLGLNMFIVDGVFEPFIMIAPSFGLRFIPSLGADRLFWPMSAGFRIWFK